MEQSSRESIRRSGFRMVLWYVEVNLLPGSKWRPGEFAVVVAGCAFERKQLNAVEQPIGLLLL